MKPETKERALAAFTIESDSILATRDAMDLDAFSRAVDVLSTVMFVLSVRPVFFLLRKLFMVLPDSFRKVMPWYGLPEGGKPMSFSRFWISAM